MSDVRSPDGPAPAGTPAARLVGETLVDIGVRQIFGVVGSGNFVATNAAVAAGARFTAARHEGGAITMASAYGWVSGQVGVCSVHQGPGLTNTLTGLVDAAKNRAPLLVLAGDTSAGATRSNFYLDQAGLVERTGAVAERLHHAHTAVEDTVRAFHRAVVERRPVVLNMPLDVQSVPVAGRKAALPPLGAPPRPALDSVARLAGLLRAARRPLILAGRGAALAGARHRLERLGELTGAVLATTAQANGMFAGNPWSVGIVGGFSSPAAADLIRRADLIVGFGTSFTTWTTRHGRLFAKDATCVQVDDDVRTLGIDPRVDVAVFGDSGETAAALADALGGAAAGPSGPAAAGWRTPDVAGALHGAPWRQRVYADAGDGERIDPRTLSIILEDILPRERILVVDGGHFLGFPVTYCSSPEPRGFVFSSAGFQSIGLGLGSAVGAATARPDRPTVLAVGDGGFLMGIAELETLARLELPVLVVVYNDAAYGAEVHHFGPHTKDLDIVRFPDTDLAAMARAAGAGAATVRTAADLVAVREWLRDGHRGPLVLDAKVVPTVVGEWTEEAFRGH